MKTKNKENRLSEFEYTLLWMAIRYAMNRETIVSATLPHEIMMEYYHKLSDNQKNGIVRDLKDNYNRLGDNAFGNEFIDRPEWMKFMFALDKSCHYMVKLNDGTERMVFNLNNQVIPLDKYIEEPYRHYFIPEENIIK